MSTNSLNNVNFQISSSTNRVIHAFTQLSSICELQEEVHQGLEEFVCLLYGKRVTKITDVATLRWQVFSRSQAESQNLPQTHGALVQHTLRAHLQSIVWSMTIG